VAWGPGQPLVMEEVEVAPPGPMEIRVKVVSTSVCRSDVTAWQSKVCTTAPTTAAASVAFDMGSLLLIVVMFIVPICLRIPVKSEFFSLAESLRRSDERSL